MMFCNNANLRLQTFGVPTTAVGYDGNGKMTVRGTQVLSYTPAEKVRTLEGPTVALSLVYGADGEQIDAANDATLVTLSVGFTGHPAELDGGLLNMGGRLYDPRLARFIQRDPVVANAANGQSYTKFNYVENRPLRLVDPTGYAATGDGTTGGTTGGGDGDDGDDGYPDGEYDDDDDGDTTGGEAPEPVRPHVLWSWTGPTAVNGDGQGGPPADMPPSDDGVGCSGTACITAVLSTQPVTSEWSKQTYTQEMSGTHAMGGNWALGVSIAMVGLMAAVVLAGDFVGGGSGKSRGHEGGGGSRGAGVAGAIPVHTKRSSRSSDRGVPRRETNECGPGAHEAPRRPRSYEGHIAPAPADRGGNQRGSRKRIANDAQERKRDISEPPTLRADD